MAALAAAFLWSVPVFAAGVSWDAVSKEELALTEPSMPSETGVEVLFRETSVDENDSEMTVTRTHVRLKVFDQRGVDALQKIDIPYDAKEARMTAIGARVIKPDGGIVEVDRKSFFTRDVIRNRYFRFKAISFSLPALEPGVIVEYKITLHSDPRFYGFFPMQDEYPTRLVRVRIRPPEYPNLKILTLYHRFPHLKPKQERGYFVFSQESVPGARDEPFAPPDEQVRSWMIYYYTFDAKIAENYWTDLGKELFRDNERLLKPRPEVQKACATIIAGAAGDLEKLERIDTFCRTQIRNLSSDISGFTPEEIEKLKPNKSAADTLANKYGTDGDLQVLFASLARAAGFDARLARCSDRSRMAFDKAMVVGRTIPDQLVAVKVGSEWWFSQPNVPYIPFGALHWTNEGEVALLADPKEPLFIRTQISDSTASLRRRVAQLTLAEDGTLEGDVTLTLSGHFAVVKKQAFDDVTPGRREELVREEVTDRLPTAEISAIALDELTAPQGALTIRYHLKLPGYAQITGQRLFIQPSIFEVGTAAVFTAEDRKHAIFFPYQSTEVDRVEIQLPEGFVLENAHSPKALDPSPTLVYDPTLSFRKKDRTLIYDRLFELKLRTVSPAQYELLKQIFGHIHQQDAHSVGVRREEAAVPAANGSES